MPRIRTRGSSLSRIKINSQSFMLQNSLLPSQPLNDYASKSHLAVIEGDTINEKYEQLLVFFEAQPDSEKNKRDRADVHFDYAYHLCVLRIYYYYCFQQANTSENKKYYLDLALIKSKALLEQIELSFSLYKTPKDKEQTQETWAIYLSCHRIILDEIKKIDIDLKLVIKKQKIIHLQIEPEPCVLEEQADTTEPKTPNAVRWFEKLFINDVPSSYISPLEKERVPLKKRKIYFFDVNPIALEENKVTQTNTIS